MSLKAVSPFRYITIVLPILLFVFSFSINTHLASAVSGSDILISSVPNNPGPNENTTVTLSTYAANLDSVLITWSINGKKSLSGVGKKSFSFTTGAFGVESRIEAVIGMPDGEITKTIYIKPAVLTLLWEANDSYVPPFYKGKALLTEGSEVKIVAMPEVKSGASVISPKNLTYSWKKDYTNDAEASGYGRNSFVFVTDYLENTSNISVIASTLDQKYSVNGNINTKTSAPEISFYRKDAGIGIDWEHALGNGHQIVSDEIIYAAPYYISPKDFRDPSLIFRWYIDDTMVDAKSFYKNLIPLKIEGGVSGTSKIKLNIENTEKLFQAAGKSINVEF